jgi:hypothetical protein
MTEASQRDLVVPNQGRAVQHLLQSLFVAELVHPSRRLWLSSGWVSDIALLDNTVRQFAALQPDWPQERIRLSRLLTDLADRGCEINVILRDVEYNRTFAAKLREHRVSGGGRLRVLLHPEFHRKGLLGEDYEVIGSMNFTHGGITVNEEHVVYRCDPQYVNERHIEMAEDWGHRFA